MKLFELDATRQTKQAAKVFESYFGGSISFDTLTRTQARHMLNRVRGLIQEHRSTTNFHTSEQNPSYMKLVVMEQGLAAKVREAIAPAPAGQGAQSQQAQMAVAIAAKRKQGQQQMAQIDKQMADLNKQKAEVQRQMNMPMSESRLMEDEVQQAQVVLASQDMVDQVQKMIEQVTSMQFKDLPALVDQVKNQIGVDQAMKFNQDVTGALTGLTQNLQGSKTQLEGALGVVTGAAPTVPGADVVAPAAELGAEELPLPPEGEEEIDVDLEEPVEEPAGTDLGRTRR